MLRIRRRRSEDDHWSRNFGLVRLSQKLRSLGCCTFLVAPMGEHKVIRVTAILGLAKLA